MRGRRSVSVAMLIAASVACGRGQDTREPAYRENNRGVALLEQFQYPQAAEAFRQALATDGSVALARLNLSLALLYAQDLRAAGPEAVEAARLLPNLPHPPYVLGLIARAESRADEALRHFERVRKIDPADAGANINLGQIHLEERRYPEAIAVLREAVRAEPFNVTAAYNLGLALTRAGQADEGRELLARAQTLRSTGYSTTYGTGYLEQGRYAEALASTGAEADLVDETIPVAGFSAATITVSGPPKAPAPDGNPPAAQAIPTPFGRRFSATDLSSSAATALAAALGGGVTLIDVEPDGDLDLMAALPNGQRLLTNDGRGGWTDITSTAGLEAAPLNSTPIGVVAGDYDNDGRIDLFVMRYGVSSIYRNQGDGRFADVTQKTGLTPYPHLPGAAAWVDVDHDGDVDLVIAGLADLVATRQRAAGSALLFPQEFSPAPLRLWRNNGDGTFADATAAAKLEVAARAVAIVPTDFDNRRDIDLLIANAGGAPLLLQNLRDGTFQDVAVETGLAAAVGSDTGLEAVTAGDVNKDDFPDFFLARASGGTFALSDGRGRFTAAAAPGPLTGAGAAQLLDYDNDGLLDIMVWASGTPRIFRNLGRRWMEVSARALIASADAIPPASPRAVAVADLTGDGTTDFITAADGTLALWRNSGDPSRRSQTVRLAGRVSNRPGAGSKVQLRAGSLIGRVEVSAATPPVAPTDIIFGLGSRPAADAVRVLWPSGILQAETLPANPGRLLVEELDRKPSSCPFLFTWNGERFVFVTDFLGAGEMGYLEAPGVRNMPDPIEYVRIGGDQLRAREGRLEIRVTNELEEALFVDRLQLFAVVHPVGIEIHPNEGMTSPPKPHRVYAVSDGRTPRATDEHGHDVTDRIADIDRKYPDDFALLPTRGYAAAHHLTLDLAPVARAPMLLLTGWTGYAFSSDNLAASQAGLALSPPSLQVKDRAGQWRTVIEQLGIPVGRPQTIPIDLTGHLRRGEHEVRIVTNMRIYWDRILVGEGAPADRIESLTVEPTAARLTSRGFSAEVRPDGRDPASYEYQRVTSRSPWKTMIGAYTRDGDVTPLLAVEDDMFVVAKPGDEIAIDFDAAPLRPLPEGWTRTFLLRAAGYSKEMDINSATPDTVGPLPFRRMTSYPYRAPETYPDTLEHDRYRSTYNTRVVVKPVPTIDSLLTRDR